MMVLVCFRSLKPGAAGLYFEQTGFHMTLLWEKPVFGTAASEVYMQLAVVKTLAFSVRSGKKACSYESMSIDFSMTCPSPSAASTNIYDIERGPQNAGRGGLYGK